MKRILPSLALLLGLCTALPVRAGAPLSGVPGRWTDDRGVTASLAQYRGKTVLLTMAYTTCRRLCPLSLNKLEEMQRDADQAGRPIEVLVISYDPKNDTPASWAALRRQRGLNRPNWHFLTGDEAGTKAIAAWLGVADFWSLDGHVMHDFRIAVVDERGNLQRQVNWDELKTPVSW